LSWLPLKITKEELAKQEAELRANWGNVPVIDENFVPADLSARSKNTEKVLKEAKKHGH